MVRIRSFIYGLIAMFLVAVCIFVWFSSTRTANVISEAPAIVIDVDDASQALKELAKFPVGEVVDEKHVALLWAPDSSKLAWFSTKQQNAAVKIYDLDTGKFSAIESNARLSLTATTWCPDGKRFLVGLYDAPALPNAKGPEFPDATLLRECDAQTGATIRELKCADFGGLCTWARYSNDGKRIVTSIEAENPNDISASPRAWAKAAIQNQQSRYTLIIENDGTTSEIAKGAEAYLMPEFTADDKWLIHKRTEYPKSAVPAVSRFLNKAFDLDQAPAEDRIVLSSVTGNGLSLTVDKIPSRYTDLITSLDVKGMLKVRYEIQNDADYDHDTARWEIWEWDQATNTITMRANLFKSLSTSFDWPIPSGSMSLNQNTDDILLSLSPPEKLLGKKWILHLDAQPRMAELHQPEGAGNYLKLSPDGSMLAFADEQSNIRIVKCDAR
ncbi:MAG: hypothetical protein IT366_01055 [Candidatus Hydrogenedentes bacterium]|nr:hypothetical protein [Candidatus Hydrogenedentota bacterium]